MKSYSFSKNRNGGFTLLEILIAAALISVAILGLFFLVTRYNVKAAVANEVQSLSQIAAETRTKFRAPGNFNAVTPEVLIQNGIINQSRVNAAGNGIVSEWSTPITVTPANLNGTAGDAVAFGYTVPRESCSDFVTGVQGSFGRITVAGAAVKDVPAGTVNLDVAALGANCDATAVGNVAVAFLSGR